MGQPVGVAAFRECGRPAAIRSDTGPPVASVGRGGRSRLAGGWIRWGIRPARSQPGHPKHKGRQERRQRTLKQPPAPCSTRSPRAFPRRLPAVEYPTGVPVRRVRSTGKSNWRGRLVCVRDALIGEPGGSGKSRTLSGGSSVAPGRWRSTIRPRSNSSDSRRCVRIRGVFHNVVLMYPVSPVTDVPGYTNSRE